MSHEMAELLVRIMVACGGIEDRHKLLDTVLPIVLQGFGAQKTQLLADRRGSGWEEIAQCSADAFASATLLFSVPSVLHGICASHHVIEKSGNATQLVLPLSRGGAPSLVLSVHWSLRPPVWIWDQDSMQIFTRTLGQFIAWKHVDLEIAAAKRHLQAIFDHLPFAMCAVNSDFTLERANKAFSDLFGLPFDRIVGRKCYEVIHGTSQPASRCGMIEAITGRKQVSMPLNGGRDLNTTFLPLIGSDGKPMVLEIFQPRESRGECPGPSNGYDFLRLYNSLSQPLTVLSLLSPMLLSEVEMGRQCDSVKMIREGIEQIVMILKEERKSYRDGAPLMKLAEQV